MFLCLDPTHQFCRRAGVGRMWKEKTEDAFYIEFFFLPYRPTAAIPLPIPRSRRDWTTDPRFPPFLHDRERFEKMSDSLLFPKIKKEKGKFCWSELQSVITKIGSRETKTFGLITFRGKKTFQKRRGENATLGTKKCIFFMWKPGKRGKRKFPCPVQQLALLFSLSLSLSLLTPTAVFPLPDGQEQQKKFFFFFFFTFLRRRWREISHSSSIPPPPLSDRGEVPKNTFLRSSLTISSLLSREFFCLPPLRSGLNAAREKSPRESRNFQHSTFESFVESYSYDRDFFSRVCLE